MKIITRTIVSDSINPFNSLQSFILGFENRFNDDTLIGILKSSFSQYLVVEFSKGASRENRVITTYLPWLFSVPSANVHR